MTAAEVSWLNTVVLFAVNPRKLLTLLTLLTLRAPADVIERWKATGPGWQTRMADRLAIRGMGT